MDESDIGLVPSPEEWKASMGGCSRAISPELGFPKSLTSAPSHSVPTSIGVPSSSAPATGGKGSTQVVDSPSDKQVPTWKVEDFARTEEWFRDVIGLPGTGINPRDGVVSAEDLEKFYGPKQTGGYPWKSPPEGKSLLNAEQRAEIMHLITYTDGRQLLPSETILVFFAKGFYLMKKGLDVNWAKFAASKHLGQLRGQLSRGNLEPTVGTGIRDPDKKYSPYASTAKEGDAKVVVTEHYKGLSLEPTNEDPLTSTLPTIGEDIQVNEVLSPRFASKSASMILPSTTPDSKCTQRSANGSYSPLMVQPVGSSVCTSVENYDLLQDYTRITRKEVDGIKRRIQELEAVVTHLQLQLGVAGKAKEDCKDRLEDLLKRQSKSQIELKEVQAKIEDLTLQEQQCSDVINGLWEEVAEAQADGGAETVVAEIQERITEENVRARNLTLEISPLVIKLQAEKEFLSGFEAAQSELKLDGEKASNDEHRCKLELIKAEGNITKLSAKLNTSSKLLMEYENMQKTVDGCQGTPLVVRMVPSPIRNWCPLFKLTNCPICHLGFSALNFLPLSCGHCYHPACGLPFLQSQEEPTCKACNQPVHLSWLQTWGIRPGESNLAMAATLGVENHSASLKRDDFALRTDHDALEHLQMENSQMRTSVTRTYTRAEGDADASLNNMKRSCLREGFLYQHTIANVLKDLQMARPDVKDKENLTSRPVKLEDSDCDDHQREDSKLSPGILTVSDDDDDVDDTDVDIEGVTEEAGRKTNGKKGVGLSRLTRSKNGIVVGEKRRLSYDPVPKGRTVKKTNSTRRESGGTSSTLATDRTPEAGCTTKPLGFVRTPKELCQQHAPDVLEVSTKSPKVAGIKSGSKKGGVNKSLDYKR